MDQYSGMSVNDLLDSDSRFRSEKDILVPVVTEAAGSSWDTIPLGVRKLFNDVVVISVMTQTSV